MTQDSSEAETQFIALSDDDVNLWDALEIVGETAKQFKIKWAGTDPGTRKPWADSWVQKHDATPDLVEAWRMKHPRRMSTASTSSSRSRSKKNSASASTRTRKNQSRGVSKEATLQWSTNSKSPVKYISRPLSDRVPKREFDEYDEPPSAGPSKLHSQLQSKKRKHSPEAEMEDESVSMAPPGPKKQKTVKNLTESASDDDDDDDDDKHMSRVYRKKTKDMIPGEEEEADRQRRSRVGLERNRKDKGKGKAQEIISDDPGFEDETTFRNSYKSRLDSGSDPRSTFNSGYVLIESIKKKKPHRPTDTDGPRPEFTTTKVKLPVTKKRIARTTSQFRTNSDEDLSDLPGSNREEQKAQTKYTSKKTVAATQARYISSANETKISKIGTMESVQRKKNLLEVDRKVHERIERSVAKKTIMSDSSVSLQNDAPQADIDGSDSFDEEDVLHGGLPLETSARQRKTASVGSVIMDKPPLGMLASVPKELSFVLNPDSPLAQSPPRKQIVAQDHPNSGSRTLGVAAGVSLPLRKSGLNQVVPPPENPLASTSNSETTHRPLSLEPVSYSPDQSPPVEPDTNQRQPVPPVPRRTQAHNSRASAPANSMTTAKAPVHGGLNRASEPMSPSRPKPHLSPVSLHIPAREPVLSPGAVARLREFDEFLASFPVTSPPILQLPQLVEHDAVGPLDVLVEDPIDRIDDEHASGSKYPGPFPLQYEPANAAGPSGPSRYSERQVHHPMDHSGDSSIVPETEPGNSQSQSQPSQTLSHPQPQSRLFPQAPYSPQHAQTRPVTSTCSPIKSGMKGRTGSYKNSSNLPTNERTTTPLDVDDMNIELSMSMSDSCSRSRSRSPPVPHSPAPNPPIRSPNSAEDTKDLYRLGQPLNNRVGKNNGDSSIGVKAIGYSHLGRCRSADGESAGEGQGKRDEGGEGSGEGNRGKGEGESKPKPKTKPSKQLGPVPVVTPSKFYPHLPSAQEDEFHISTGLDDSIETWPSPEKQSMKITASIEDQNTKRKGNGTGRSSEAAMVAGSSNTNKVGDENVDIAKPELRKPAAPDPQKHAPMSNVISLSQNSDAFAEQVLLRGSEMAEARRRQQRQELGLDPPKRRSLDEIVGNTGPGKGKGKGKVEAEVEAAARENHGDGGPLAGDQLQAQQSEQIDVEEGEIPDTGANPVRYPVHIAFSPYADVDEEQDLDESNFELRYPDESPESGPETFVPQVDPHDASAAGPSVVASDSLLYEITALKKKFTAVNASNKSLISELVSLRSVKAHADELARKNDALQKENLYLQKELDDIISASTTARISKDSAYAEMNLKHEQLEQQIRTLKLQNNTLQQQNEAFEQQSHTLEKQRQFFEQQILTLKQQCQTLEQQNHNLEQQHQILEQRDRTLEEQHQTIDQRTHILQQQLQTFEQQNLALSEELSAAVAAKSYADKDRDFFRDQYNTASGYASEVRSDNVALLQRAEIAEKQASEGVALIKATYEERLRVSEDQSRAFSRIADFMMKKDQATDGVRRQAAEAPELRAKCSELEEEIRGMREEARKLEGEIELEQLKVEALEREKEDGGKIEPEGVLKMMRDELRESKLQLARVITELNEIKASKNHDGINGVETNNRVFRCEWRQAGVGPCLFVCETRQELEDHIVHGGHIKLP